MSAVISYFFSVFWPVCFGIILPQLIGRVISDTPFRPERSERAEINAIHLSCQTVQSRFNVVVHDVLATVAIEFDKATVWVRELKPVRLFPVRIVGKPAPHSFAPFKSFD